MSESSVQAISIRLRNTISNVLLAPSRIYIVEHLLALISLALWISAMAGLLYSLIDYFSGHITDDYQSEMIFLNMSVLLISLVTFFIFYTRSRKAERKYPKLLQSRMRRRLNYLWLTISGLVFLGYAIALLNVSLASLLGVETVALGKSWLNMSLKQLCVLVLLMSAITLVARMNPGLERLKK